jgi:hypothetical protein
VLLLAAALLLPAYVDAWGVSYGVCSVLLLAAALLLPAYVDVCGVSYGVSCVLLLAAASVSASSLVIFNSTRGAGTVFWSTSTGCIKTIRRPLCPHPSGCSHSLLRQHTSAYVSIRQHTLAYVSMRLHTSAYVSMRQHTSAYVSIR